MAKKKQHLNEDMKLLISSVTGFETGDENFDICLSFAKSNFKYHRYLSPDSHKLKRDVEGMCDKFRVHSQGHKAEALAQLSEDFLNSPGLDGQPTGQTDVHYAVLSFLLRLAQSPTKSDFQKQAAKEVIEEPKDTFDWTSYLLEDEDRMLVSYSSSDSDPDDDLTDSEESSGGEVTQGVKGSRADPTEVSCLDENKTLEQSNDASHDPSVLSHDPSVLSHEDENTQLEQLVMVRYWEGKSTEEGIEGGHSCSNLIRDWNYFKKQENEFVTFTATVVVTEAQIMREALWMLSGVTELFIFKHSGKEFILNPDVYMMHLTTESLDCCLKPLIRKANQVQALCTFVAGLVAESSQSTQTHSTPQTYQAFGCCVSKFLADLRAVLTPLEVKVMQTETMMTLDVLTSTLRPWMDKVQSVHGLYISGVAQPSHQMQNANNCVRATILLDSLYDAVFEQELVEVSDEEGQSKLLFQMLIATSEPLLRIASDWLNFGQLIDPRGEFVLHRNQDIKSLDETFWEKAFVSNLITEADRSMLATGPSSTDTTVQTDADAAVKAANLARYPKFLRSILGEVILTGKSMEMLENLGRMGDALGTGRNMFERPMSLYSHFLQELNVKMSSKSPDTSDCNRQETHLEEPKSPNLVSKQLLIKGEKDTLLHLNLAALFSREVRISGENDSSNLNTVAPGSLRAVLRVCESTLRPYVATRYVTVCSCLLHILQTDYNLLQCLQAMQRYFLMSAGEVMYDFYTRVFIKLQKREFWRDQGLLDMYIQEALENSWPEDSQRLGVTLEGGGAGQGIAATDCIQLKYNVPWPVDVVISSKLQTQYNHIFNFLMQIKRSKFTLEQLRFEDLSRNHLEDESKDPHGPAGLATDVFQVEDSMPLPQRIHRFQLLKFRLLYFVNSLHTYMMTRILHSEGLEFSEQLRSAPDLEQVIQLHQHYVSLIHDRCLLHPKLAILKKAVGVILNLALTLSHQWRGGGALVSGAAVLELEQELSRCVTFLESFLNTIIKRGSFPHLESLAFALAPSL